MDWSNLMPRAGAKLASRRFWRVGWSACLRCKQRLARCKGRTLSTRGTKFWQAFQIWTGWKCCKVIWLYWKGELGRPWVAFCHIGILADLFHMPCPLGFCKRSRWLRVLIKAFSLGTILGWILEKQIDAKTKKQN